MPHNLRQLSLFGAPVELDGEVAADEPLPPSLQVRGQTNLFGAEEPVGSPSRGAASANQPTEAPPSAPRPATRSAAERATALAQLAQEAVGVPSAADGGAIGRRQIGRASCRERV